MATHSWRRYVHQFGAIEGIEVGARYETRFDLKWSGLHVSDKAICYTQRGVVSVMVQNNYEDYGDLIKITTSHKLKNVLYVSSTVKSFHVSLESKVPVRVIRQPIGGQYAPLVGYRYDGLYIIEKKTNRFDTNMLRLKHIFYLVRLPSQPQVYELRLSTTDTASSETEAMPTTGGVLEPEEMPNTDGVCEPEVSQDRCKLEISEYCEETLSDVD